MKLLFLAEAVSLAHIGRPLTLANWALQNGHEVHFACATEGIGKIGESSFLFPTYPLKTISSELFYGRVKKGQFFYTYQEMLEYVEEEKKLISEINPDLVISDFRLTAPISTKLCNKPLLNLSNSHWSPDANCPFPAPNAGFFKWLPPVIRKGLFSLLRPIAFKVYATELNKLRRNYGLDKKKDFRELYTEGTYTGFMDMPDFTLIENKPDHHFFLGPIIWNPKIKEQNLKLESKNNIYISMGSSGDNHHLDAIIKSILKTSSYIILSGISSQEELVLRKKFPSLANRSTLKSLIDPETILPNCCLTICHGGSGTVYQSLAHGVPVLCFPDNPDQHLVSYAVVRQNLGCLIPQNKSNEKKIYKSILECLNNSFLKKNVQAYKEKIRSYNTHQNWLHFLSSLAPMPKAEKISIFNASAKAKPIRPSGVSIAFNQAVAPTKFHEIVTAQSSSEYTIKLATTLEEREEVFRLAYKVYLEKGYIKKNYNEWLISKYDANPETAILIIKDKDKKIIGSATMVFDGPDSLPAGKVFFDEVNLLRLQKEKIVEISRLVIDPNYRNAKEILIKLFNYVYIFSFYVKKYSCLAIEVNPRHKEFYRSLLAFEEIASEKPCPNVQGAPAVLLHIPLWLNKAEIFKGLNNKLEGKNRTLFSQFLSLEKEILVTEYLQKKYKPISKEEKNYFGFADSEIGTKVHA